MLTALEKNVESFPHPTFPPIVGQPSYVTIVKLKLKHNTNVSSIYSHGGDGRLVLLYLTVRMAVYNTQSTTPFASPVNPGQKPTIPSNPTGLHISEARRQHKEKFDEFQAYQQTDRALKRIPIVAVK